MAIDLKQYRDIPHGDMPGDKVEIGEEHVKKANVIMDSLCTAASCAFPSSGVCCLRICVFSLSTRAVCMRKTESVW